MKTKKNALVIVLFFCSFICLEVKAQYMPNFNATQTHPGWYTAVSFSGNQNFIDGFCFAWEGISPLANGFTSNANLYYVRNVGPEISGMPYTTTMEFITVTLPSGTGYYESAQSVRAYGQLLYNEDPILNAGAKEFWDGYALLLELVNMNPNILLLQPGEGV